MGSSHVLSVLLEIQFHNILRYIMVRFVMLCYDVSVYDKDHLSELRIKNTSESVHSFSNSYVHSFSNSYAS